MLADLGNYMIHALGFNDKPTSRGDRACRLTAAQLANVERSLTNPDVRVPLRADFPPLLSYDKPDELLEVLTRELAKCGKTWADAGQVTIIYPSKDTRLFPLHNNGKGVLAGMRTEQALRKAWRRQHGGRMPTKVRNCDLIAETSYLNRSNNQDSLHALTKRQQYVARRPWFSKNLPFLSSDYAEKEHFFVIADCFIEQGTTVANLASYITHNGGHVLAAVQSGDRSGMPLVPQNAFGPFEGQHTELKGIFAAAANNRGLAALGFFLARSAERAGITITRDDALAQVESSSNAYGQSLTALTHAETMKLIQSLQVNAVTFKQLVDLPPAHIPTIAQSPALRAQAGVRA